MCRHMASRLYTASGVYRHCAAIVTRIAVCIALFYIIGLAIMLDYYVSYTTELMLPETKLVHGNFLHDDIVFVCALQL